MRTLLVTCDLGWVQDMDVFRASLESHFENVILAPLATTLDGLDLAAVTDWVTDPAPRFKINSDLIKTHLPALKRIGSPSTGTTHLTQDVVSGDIAVRCLRDIPVSDLARITSSSEHTFYLFLSLLRKAKRLFSADLSEWRDDIPKYRGHQVEGMRVLIFGHGRIGANQARYLEAFGADVTLYDPDTNKHSADRRFVSRDALPSEIAQADAVLLCFHWSKDNDKFFGPAFLDAMRDDAFFVNTSRGENLDELHLAKLIEAGKFAGVALDVLTGEQSPEFGKSPLFALEKKTDRLIITPHIAGASFDSERLAFEFILDQVLDMPS